MPATTGLPAAAGPTRSLLVMHEVLDGRPSGGTAFRFSGIAAASRRPRPAREAVIREAQVRWPRAVRLGAMPVYGRRADVATALAARFSLSG